MEKLSKSAFIGSNDMVASKKHIIPLEMPIWILYGNGVGKKAVWKPKPPSVPHWTE